MRDDWMASPTQWTWVWVSSGSWWWTGKSGVLQSMGLQRVGPDWATELNWTELILLSLGLLICKTGDNRTYVVVLCGSDMQQVCLNLQSLIVDFFKSVEFVTILLLLLSLFLMFWSLLFNVLVFLPWGMWDFSSPIRDHTRNPCIGRQNLNHWTTREVPCRLL